MNYEGNILIIFIEYIKKWRGATVNAFFVVIIIVIFRRGVGVLGWIKCFIKKSITAIGFIFVGDQHQCLEAAQYFIAAPLSGQVDDGIDDVALMFVQLLLK